VVARAVASPPCQAIHFIANYSVKYIVLYTLYLLIYPNQIISTYPDYQYKKLRTYFII